MRVIVLGLLAIWSAGAVAEWVQVGGSDAFNSYADSATVSRSGNIVKILVMHDYKTTRVSRSDEGSQYLSSKEQREYDCKDERSRLLNFSWYSGNMGNGNAVYSDDSTPGNWKPIIPGSAGEIMWKYACGKGLAQEKDKAFQLYSEAAQKGNLSAQYNLGMLYATGEGVSQDFSKAEYWWTKAAERGLMQAQFNLGNLYYSGVDGEKKPAEARKWLTLAAQQGSPHAKEILAKIDANVDVGEGQTPKVASPVSAPDTTRARTTTDTLRREAWVLAQPRSHYTIQILSIDSESWVREYIAKHGLSANTAYLETKSQGAPVFKVLYGNYASRDLARKAMATLSDAISAGSPWIRSFAEVHALVDSQYSARGAR